MAYKQATTRAQRERESREERERLDRMVAEGRTASGRNVSETFAAPKAKNYSDYVGNYKSIMAGDNDLQAMQKARSNAFYARNYLRQNEETYDAERCPGAASEALSYIDRTLTEINNMQDTRTRRELDAQKAAAKRRYEARQKARNAGTATDEGTAQASLESQPEAPVKRAQLQTPAERKLSDGALSNLIAATPANLRKAQEEQAAKTARADAANKLLEELRLTHAIQRGVADKGVPSSMGVVKRNGNTYITPAGNKVMKGVEMPRSVIPNAHGVSPGEYVNAMRDIDAYRGASDENEKARLQAARDAAVRLLGEEAALYATGNESDYYERYMRTQQEHPADRYEGPLLSLNPDSLNEANRFASTVYNQDKQEDILRRSQLTEEERATYESLLRDYGYEAAENYIETLKSEMNQRLAMAETNDAARFANDHPILSNASTVASSVLDSPALAKHMFDRLTGVEQDPYDPLLNIQRRNEAIRGQTAQNIQNSIGGTPGNVFSFIYQGGMSALDAAANSLFWGGLGNLAGGTATAMNVARTGAAANYFGTAATSAFNDAIERGGTVQQANRMAAISGIAEVLFEKFSIDGVWKMASGNNLGSAVKNVLRQMGVEASEEAATEVANIIGDVLVMKDLSQYQTIGEAAKDVGLSAAGGAFGGLLTGSGAAMFGNHRRGKSRSNGGTDNFQGSLQAPESSVYSPQEGPAQPVSVQGATDMGMQEEPVSEAVAPEMDGLRDAFMEYARQEEAAGQTPEAPTTAQEEQETSVQPVSDAQEAPSEQSETLATDERNLPLLSEQHEMSEASSEQTQEPAAAPQNTTPDVKKPSWMTRLADADEKMLNTNARNLPDAAKKAFVANTDETPDLTISQYKADFLHVYGAAKKGKTLEEAKALTQNGIGGMATVAAWNAGHAEYEAAHPKAAEANEALAQPVNEQPVDLQPVEQPSADIQSMEQAPAKEETPSSGTPSSTLAGNLLSKYIRKGTAFNSAVLFEAADKAFGGTQANGTYTPKDAYDAMELAVNTHLLTKARGMNGNAKTAVSALNKLENMLSKLPTQTKRTEEQQQFQQFSTPPNIAYLAAWLGNVNENDTVLEPSAGVGGIAAFAKAWGATTVVNELSERRLAVLREMGFDRVFNENAEQLNNLLPDDVKPTVVLMNPPFSSTAGRTSKNSTANATRHIEQALLRLEDGGRLVAVLGKGMSDDAPAFQKWFGSIREKYNIRANVRVDGSNYKKYGTTWDVQLMVIDKTGPQQGKTITGVYKNLKDIPAALEEVRNGRTEVSVASGDRQAEQNGAVADVREGGRALQTGQPVSGATDRGSGVSDRNQLSEDDDARAHRAGGNQRDRAAGPIQSGMVRSSDRGEQLGGTVDRDASRVQKATTSRVSDVGRGNGNLVGDIPGKVSGDGLGTVVEREHRSDVRDGGRTVRKTGKKQSKSDDGINADYQPASMPIKGMKPHPAKLVESAAMSAVEAPEITYVPKIPKAVIESGAISDAQLENISRAGQSFDHILPNGTRQGYFIGDGTGVGKGREISGVIMDSFNRGQKKAVWLSDKPSLLEAARRDYAGIGGDPSTIVDFQKQARKGALQGEGVMFLPYTTLIGKGSDKQSHVDRIVEWLGKDFDGVIAFDEAHNMANAGGGVSTRGKIKPSQKALSGIELQDKLPNARVLYVSATGATEVRNLLYAQRLGLWGEGTPFRSGIDFVEKIGASGVAAMELVSRDMKAKGVYMARSISYDGVEYNTLSHKLTSAQREMYDTSAKAWQITLQNMNEALKVLGDTKGKSKQRSTALSAYYGAMQRFYNQALITMSMPSVLESVHNDLDNGLAPVIQLKGTSKAEMDRQMEKIKAEGGTLEDIDVSPKETLIGFLRNSFPVNAMQEVEDERGNIRLEEIKGKDGKPVVDREAVRIRDELIAEINAIRMPSGALDMIIDEFGAKNVAEITGRDRRLEYVENEKGETERKSVKRNPEMRSAEAKEFQNGDRQILVFSDAGGTGASYHADRAAKNQKRRVMYMLEPGWEAAKAIQYLGRVHRSNQASEPIIRLVTTDVMGQKRFVSTIAKRISQLGALTKGQRDAGGSVFSEKDNLESPLAMDALAVFYGRLANDQLPDFKDGEGTRLLQKINVAKEILDEHGNIKNSSSVLRDTSHFFNRILALEVADQNKLFNAYSDILDEAYEAAEARGELDKGMETVKADKAEVIEDRVIREDKETGATTRYVQVKVSNKAKILKTLKDLKGMRNNFEGVYRTEKGAVVGVFQIADTTDRWGMVRHQYLLQSPTRTKSNRWVETTLKTNAQKLPESEWESAWAEEVARQPEYTEETKHMLTGVLLPVWDMLPQDGRAKVQRVMTDDGAQYLGRIISPSEIDGVLGRFGVNGSKKKAYTPSQVHKAVLGGAKATLAGRYTLERVRVNNENRIELKGPNAYYEARNIPGMIVEMINFNYRAFVPTGETGVAVLEKLLSNKPVMGVENEVEFRRKQPAQQHTPEQLKVMREYEAAVDDLVLRIAKMYRINKGAKENRVKIASVSDRLAQDIHDLLGIDVRGYTVSINRSGFNHIERRHGENGEHDHSMSDLKDVARMGYVVKNYDSIEILRDEKGNQEFSRGNLDSMHNRAPLLLIKKRIDGTYYIAEAVADNSWKKIWVETAYIQKAKVTSDDESGNLPPTLRPGRPPSSPFATEVTRALTDERDHASPKLTSKTFATSPSADNSITQKEANAQEHKNSESASAADWRTKRVGDANRSRIGIAEIVAKIRQKYNVSVRSGHIRGTDVLGSFNTRTSGMRSRIAQDLPTISHELGHYLNKTFALTSGMSKEARDETLSLLTYGERNDGSTTMDSKLSEGMAEFVRRYLKNREVAAIDCPHVVEHVRGKMRAEDLKLLDELADDVNAYFSLGANDAQDNIKLREDKIKDYRTRGEKLRDGIDRFRMLIDDLQGLKRMDRELGTDTHMHAVNAAYAADTAGNLLSGELRGLNGQLIGPGLKKVLEGIDLSRKDNSREFREFGEYLVVKHGPERLAQGLRVFADDVKNSSQWMENRQKQLEAQYPAFKEASERLYQFIHDFYQEYAVESGLISKETLKSWGERWQYYVPFNRIMPDNKNGIGAKRGFANQNSTIKRAKGSGLDIMNPVENLIGNMVTLVSAARRNLVMQRVADAAESLPDSARFIERIPDVQIRQRFSTAGLKMEAKAQLNESEMEEASREIAGGVLDNMPDFVDKYVTGRPRDDVVTVLNGGVPAFYQVNDRLLLDSLVSMAPQHRNVLLDSIGAATRFVTSNLTGKNIIWSIFSNAPRDVMSTLAYGEHNPVKLFTGIASAYKNAVKGENADPLFKEYQAMGGGNASVYTADRNMQKQVRKQWTESKAKYLNPMELIEFVSNVIETGPRYAVYRSSRMKGLTPQEAFYASLEATVNFRRGSRTTKGINKVFSFFNAGVQGIDRFVRFLTADDVRPTRNTGDGWKAEWQAKKRKATLSRLAALSASMASMALLTHAANSGDEEKEKDYANLSGYQKFNNWLLPLGDGKYFAIPKPRELAVLSSAFQAMLEKSVSENKYAFDGMWEYLTSVLLPTGISEIAQGNVGTLAGNMPIIGPMTEIYANKDYLGRPIVSAAYESLEAQDQYNDRTSKLAKWIGDVLHISPMHVDHVGSNVFGGFWEWQTALYPVGEENVDTTLGVKNKYVKDSLYSTDHVNRMYEYQAAAEKAKNSDPDNMQKQAKYYWLSGMTTFYSRYRKLAYGQPETASLREAQRSVLEMIDGMNQYADGKQDSERMRAVEAIASETGATDVFPATMQPYIKDSAKKQHNLTAEQYLAFQTDYLGRYWDYVEQVLSTPATANLAGLKAAKERAASEAKQKVLSDVLHLEQAKLQELSADLYFQYEAAMSTADTDNSGSIKKEEVLAALDRLEASEADKSKMYAEYSDSVPGNPYKSAGELNDWIAAQEDTAGAKNSITNTYRPLIISSYVRGDDEEVNRLLDKLMSLDLYDGKGNPYYTYSRVMGWIDDWLEAQSKK